MFRDTILEQEDALQEEADRWVGDLEALVSTIKEPVSLEVPVAHMSTALTSFGYDPANREFMIQWQGSETKYIFPGIYPDEAAEFLENAFVLGSYGKAANLFKADHEEARLLWQENEIRNELIVRSSGELMTIARILRELGY